MLVSVRPMKKMMMMMATVLVACAVSSLSIERREEQTDIDITIAPTPQAGGRRRPLRPTLSISERIVPIQLVDTYAADDHIRVPRRKQSRPRMLFGALDKDFDSEWMSVERPAVVSEGPVLVATSSNHHKMRSEALAQVNQEFSANLTEGTRSLLEEWLVSKASCPVRYVWDDVGPLFWPRWIKRGECVNSAERSCSWPTGMHCIPAESVTIHLLRWHCRPRSRKPSPLPSSSSSSNSKVTVESAGVAVDKLQLKMKQLRQMAAAAARRRQRNTDAHDHKRLRCQWLKVPYPVTAECICSC